jgi:hypothetical protein
MTMAELGTKEPDSGVHSQDSQAILQAYVSEFGVGPVVGWT